MMSLLRILFVTLIAAGSGWAQPAQAPAPDLPKILLIGDSISGGYQRQVKKAFEGRALVVKNEGNAEWSGTGVKKIDSYLGTAKWDVIHFNWGLWDIYGWEYHQEDRSPEAYAKRLDALVTRMKQTGAKLIWATTTPACKEPEQTMRKRFHQTVQITPEQQQKYANAALAVMKKHGVAVNDLYAQILPHMQDFGVGPDDVHYNAAGCDFLAKQVITAVDAALKQKK